MEGLRPDIRDVGFYREDLSTLAHGFHAHGMLNIVHTVDTSSLAKAAREAVRVTQMALDTIRPWEHPGRDTGIEP